MPVMAVAAQQVALGHLVVEQALDLVERRGVVGVPHQPRHAAPLAEAPSLGLCGLVEVVEVMHDLLAADDGTRARGALADASLGGVDVLLLRVDPYGLVPPRVV